MGYLTLFDLVTFFCTTSKQSRKWNRAYIAEYNWKYLLRRGFPGWKVCLHSSVWQDWTQEAYLYRMIRAHRLQEKTNSQYSNWSDSLEITVTTHHTLKINAAMYTINKLDCTVWVEDSGLYKWRFYHFKPPEKLSHKHQVVTLQDNTHL